MPGLNAHTGKSISGWEHVEQSIERILLTRIGTRVMRRDLGADVPRLQDANPTAKIIMQFYVAIAEALDKWEPRFSLSRIEMTKAGRDGRYSFQLTGIYFPKGHLGDYSLAEDRAGTYLIARAM